MSRTGHSRGSFDAPPEVISCAMLAHKKVSIVIKDVARSENLGERASCNVGVKNLGGGGLEVRAGSKTDLLTTSISNPGALLANLLLIGRKEFFEKY